MYRVESVLTAMTICNMQFGERKLSYVRIFALSCDKTMQYRALMLL